MNTSELDPDVFLRAYELLMENQALKIGPFTVEQWRDSHLRWANHNLTCICVEDAVVEMLAGSTEDVGEIKGRYRSFYRDLYESDAGVYYKHRVSAVWWMNLPDEEGNPAIWDYESRALALLLAVELLSE